MQKDYIPVSASQSSEDESAFVENFWTQRWEERAQLPDAASIAGREEHLLMLPYLTRLPGGARILDGGCGMGEWTVFYANQGFDAVGIDLSDRTIERLNHLLPNYKFVRGDIRKMEFPDSDFDAYFSWGTFEHFENGLGDCINEAYRIMKPGGWLFVSVPFHNWRHIWKGLRAPSKWDPQENKMRFYQWRLARAELALELAMRGFKVDMVKPITKEHGIQRMLQHDFGVPMGTRENRKLAHWLVKFVPANYCSHMILAAAQKVVKE